MVLFIISLIAGAAMLVLFLTLRVKKADSRAAVAKAITSLCFILTALSAAYANGNTSVYKFALLVVAGLVCGLLGDIWLDLKFVYPSDGDFFTYAGFLSFAAGHFFYIAAVICGIGFSIKAVICAVAAAVLAAVVIAFTEKPMKLVYGKFKKISCFYAAVLFGITVFCASSAIFISTERTTAIIMTAGAVFFVISDLILSGTYFGEGKNRPSDVITNHVTYYIAQFLIASSVLFIGK